MNNIIWENSNLVFIGTENRLTVIKKRQFKINQVFLLILMPITLVTIIFLLTMFTDIKIKDTTLSYTLLIVVSLYITLVYINSTVQTIFNIKNLVIKIGTAQIFVNETFFCNTTDLEKVIIQPSYGSFGLGMSYTLGIKSINEAKPLLHFLGHKDSKTMATILSDFFSVEYMIKNPLLFRTLSKW